MSESVTLAGWCHGSPTYSGAFCAVAVAGPDAVPTMLSSTYTVIWLLWTTILILYVRPAAKTTLVGVRSSRFAIDDLSGWSSGW